MFAVSLVGPGAWRRSWAGGGRGGGRAGRSACVLAFGLAAGIGVAPRLIGGGSTRTTPIASSSRRRPRREVLARERPDPGAGLPAPAGRGPSPARASRPSPTRGRCRAARRTPRSRRASPGWRLVGHGLVGLSLFARAMLALRRGRSAAGDPVGRAVRWGLLASARRWSWPGSWSTGTSPTRTIIATWSRSLVPWSSGFGLVMARDRGTAAGGALGGRGDRPLGSPP